MRRCSILTPLILLPLVCVGCVGTSDIFKRSVAKPISDAVSDLREYNASNPTAPPAEKQVISDLGASVAEPSKITLQGVKQAWTPAAPVLREYITNDSKLDMQSVNIRLRTTFDIDDLIAAEEARQNGVLSGITKQK
jgi:hypothetical protein